MQADDAIVLAVAPLAGNLQSVNLLRHFFFFFSGQIYCARGRVPMLHI